MAVETAEDIFLRHALTHQELTALQLDPGRAARELIRRGGTELRRLGQDADPLCRRMIEGAYRGLLADPAVLPRLERAFQQAVLERLDALSDLPEQLRAVLAALSNFGVVDIASAGPSMFFAAGCERLEDAYLSPDQLFNRLGLGRDLQDFSPRPTLTTEINSLLADSSVRSGWVVLEAEAGLGKTALMAYLARTRQWAHHFVQRTDQDTTDRIIALRSLSAQLIPACGLHHLLQGGGLPERAAGRTDWLYRVLDEASQRRTAAGITDPLVLVVDGLDEAEPVDGGRSGIPLGLPEDLPDGVFIVAARRGGSDRTADFSCRLATGRSG